MRRIAVALGCALATACAGAPPPPRVEAWSMVGFPLERGDRWTYEGTLRWYDPTAPEQTREGPIRWTMEVVDAFDRGPIAVAVLRGHPQDLAATSGDPQRGDWLIARTGGQAFYLLRATPPLVQQFRVDTNPAELLAGEPPFLQLPLVQGAQICEPSQAARRDAAYCWTVESVDAGSALAGIRGLPTGAAGRRAQLAYRTNPDETVVQFVEGVGITAFRYRHHGTPADADVHLVEFHRGPSAAPRR